MKIALVSPYTLPVCRGNSLTVQRLCDGLRSRGHSVSIFNSTTDRPEELAGFTPDVIHALHALRPHPWLMESKIAGSCPRVVTMTGTDYSEGDTSEVLHALSDAQALIVFHEEAAECVRTRFPDLAERVNVIPQSVSVSGPAGAVPEEVRRTWNLSDDEFVIFMAAGVRPVKNIGYALKVFELFRQKYSRARLLLAGPELDAQESCRVRAQAEQIEGFSYCGELSHEQVLKLMQATDVFLNTSLHEGMPGAVMEAMSAGCAVIATDVPGNRALIANMRTGVLVPLHAPQVLCDAIAMLAARADLRYRLGEQARDEMQSRYGCEAELQAYEELYKKSIAR